MGATERYFNIIGCGKTGKALGRLFASQRLFSIRDIVTTSQESAEMAVSFVGAGDVCRTISELRQADFLMIATPDSEIISVVRHLLSRDVVVNGAVVFHCSGALSSELLTGLRDRGASIASVHPVKSFSDPIHAVSSFNGTHCGIEGDERAVAELSLVFESIGARVFRVKSDSKQLYHAASVFACNYLTALLECAVQCAEQAGIERGQAIEIITPLVRETVEAALTRGVDSALTGPISRGDAEIVATQYAGLSKWRSNYGELYRLLGEVVLEIASRSGALQGKEAQPIKDALVGCNRS